MENDIITILIPKGSMETIKRIMQRTNDKEVSVVFSRGLVLLDTVLQTMDTPDSQLLVRRRDGSETHIIFNK